MFAEEVGDFDVICFVNGCEALDPIYSLKYCYTVFIGQMNKATPGIFIFQDFNQAQFDVGEDWLWELVKSFRVNQ